MKDAKSWSRLDNAAKIFPPTATRRDTKVFRFVCELYETVEPELLQQAADDTLADFPLYRSVLKKGLFWYYFEESNLRPIVREESRPPCGPLYKPDKPALLFQVTWFASRINLEVFHALADGTGAMHFLRALVYRYLTLRHPGEICESRLDDYDASPDQRKLDAFYKYYDRGQKAAVPKKVRAHRIRGERLPAARLGVIEAVLSAKAVLALARQYEATLSELLVALLLLSINDNMAVRERRRPVVITVPVDLRRFFPAQTARNFFGVIQAGYNFSKGGDSLEEVLAQVRRAFAGQLTQENLLGIINRYSAIESNPLVKAVPLFLKTPCLKLAGWWAEGQDTAAFSNVGRIGMPEPAGRYIKLFDVFLSTKRPQICLCSSGDTLTISVSSPLRATDVQRSFFRRLVELGLEIQLSANTAERGMDDANL